ncbi:MAG: PfkB family carbohydrate kinase [Fusobacteriaceae bacterium]|jgi:D-beta-D-heptose 7-phosphate kinase/D-beta-D-heptose 1-phosphate adenosyltransferase|nr:PfkB family carbohydrate kinase [Fusobacteriaceae bacterium]
MTARQRLAEIVRSEFPKKTILVLGDIMVDKYTRGKVSRISPEAPIQILEFEESKLTAGGASNVTANLVALGARVELAGTAAEDEYGLWLRSAMQRAGVGTECILAEAGRPTTLKERFATKSQQLLRVDREKSGDITAETQKAVLDWLKERIGRIDAVLLSDYRKGVLSSPEFVKRIIALCKSHGVIVAIDSKSPSISAFAGATFVKPNNLELEQAVNIRITDDESLDRAGNLYLKTCGARYLIVTRGARGISVFSPDKARQDFSSKALQVYDVTGAGDTVISTITLGIVSGLSIEEATVLGNLAASVVVSKIGTAVASLDELVARIGESLENS